MPFLPQLNFDIVAFGVLRDIAEAMKDWLAGQPRSEEAFMNQVTGRLVKRRRNCDVGVEVPVGMRSEIALLHRRNPNSTDKYGADLAVTIYVQDTDYVKTALFQIKRCQGYKCKLEKRQLDDALADERIAPRCFVLAIDEERHGIRIESAKTLVRSYEAGQLYKTFECSGWTCLTQWVWGWFSCDIGPESSPTDPRSVESLLQAYIVEEEWQSPWRVGEPADQLDSEMVPARAWLIITFAAVEEAA